MRTTTRWIPANERIVNTACAIGDFNMKFNELLSDYITLRQEVNCEDYYERTSIMNLQYDRDKLQYLLEEMDKILEGVNRAEQS